MGNSQLDKISSSRANDFISLPPSVDSLIDKLWSKKDNIPIGYKPIAVTRAVTYVYNTQEKTLLSIDTEENIKFMLGSSITPNMDVTIGTAHYRYIRDINQWIVLNTDVQHIFRTDIKGIRLGIECRKGNKSIILPIFK